MESSGLAEPLDDARLDLRAPVRESNRPKDRRTAPSDERAEAPIIVGEVKPNAPGVSQRLDDLIVDVLRVNPGNPPCAGSFGRQNQRR